MIRKIRNLSINVRRALQAPVYGFIQGHDYLPRGALATIEALVGTDDASLVREFEAEFMCIQGGGEAVAFAAGRMAFHALLLARSIGAGHEVILLGSTCAVMANAVLRAGARPVYADIDPDTFGSSAPEIAKKITSRTRMIVAQHSFGIPCDIEPIMALARARSLFLLEDCAISVGSKIGSTAVGHFGDASLFSMDHSKPINSMIGGLIVTADEVLARALREIQSTSGELPVPKQNALWERLLFERDNSQPHRYASIRLREQLARYFGVDGPQPFLMDDAGASTGAGYPYPAKMPPFLAAVGLEELKRWNSTATDRRVLLARLLECTRGTWVEPHLPSVYRDPRLDIVPLRFAWSQTEGPDIRDRLSRFVDVDWTWFRQPLIATVEPLANLGYVTGSCPVSERVGQGVINLPCNVSGEKSPALVEMFSAMLRKHELTNQTAA
jgi:perosamine synthetase